MSLNPLEEMYNAKPTLNEVDRIRLSDELERNAVEDTPSSEDDTKPQQKTESSKEDKTTPQPSSDSSKDKRKATNKEVIEKLSKPGELLKDTANTWAAQKPGWDNPGAYPSAAAAGLIDFGIGFLNKIPKKNLPGIENPFHNEQGKIPHLPKYEHQGLQATRDIASVVLPTIYLNRFLKGAAGNVNAKVGWSLGKDKFVRWISRAGIAAGSGAIVDEIAPVQEREHNIGGQLKKNWPAFWSWYPESWATMDGEGADKFREKNRNENIGVGLFADTIGPLVRLFKSKQGIKEATRWVPKNEQAKNWQKKNFDKPKLSEDPFENDLLEPAKARDDALTDLGRSKIEDGADLTVPAKGIHDVYDYTESGVRAVDNGGIVTAAKTNVQVVKQIDSRYGRVANFISPRNLRELLSGKENPLQFFKRLGKELDETKVDWKGSKGKLIKHADMIKEADKLGAALYNTDLEGMKKILRPLTSFNATTGQRSLTGAAYKGVMSAIKKYGDEFINLSKARSEGLAGTSISGQVSDISEGTRLMEGTLSVKAGYEDILDRLEFLMNLQGQTKLTGEKALSLGNLVSKLKSKTFNIDPTDAARAIDSERNATLRALEGIANESRETIATLRNVQKERPQLLSPLMLAYEATDGNIKSITALNNYIRNTSGTVSKAFFDARAEMPSAWTQGVWANIYNSVLSALGTPLKAAASNTVLMVERPLATFAGAILGRDLSQLRRAHYMYNVGIGETVQRSWSHMNQIFKRASQDPSSVGYIMRDDIARKNAAQMDIMRTFADAAEEQGNYGPTIFTNHIEDLNDLAEHPWLRFGANAMTAFDGFTRSWIGNVEARARAYDAIMSNGGRLTSDRVRAIARRSYAEMFDETGMITDRAVEYASKEIAMNLDNSLVSSLNELVKAVPAVKPFVMFPKTSTNIMRFAGSHNPLGLFFDQLNAFELPFEKMPIKKVRELLTERGLGTSGDLELVYNNVRAELKGRKAIGSLAVTSAVGLFMNDRITGSGIYDRNRQRTRRELGQPRDSIKGLDGKWYSYENLGAITDWLQLTVDIADNFSTLDEANTEVLLNRMMYILSANLTDKTFMSGLEPLGDVLSGNGAALNRWAGTFGSSLLPGGGIRNEFARLLTPQLKEVEMEFTQILANRNPFVKDTLADLYDWMDGSKVKEPANFATRVWNTYSPWWKISEKITPEKEFLMDIEWDGRPSLRTNGRGIEYSNEQRSEVTRIMGEDGLFVKEVRRLMNSSRGKNFRKEWKEATKSGVYFDRTKFQRLHDELDFALDRAQSAAESRLEYEDYKDIQKKTYLKHETGLAAEQNNVERILDLQRN